MTLGFFQCMECGKRMSQAQADMADRGVRGCPHCGGSDVDFSLHNLPRERQARRALHNLGLVFRQIGQLDKACSVLRSGRFGGDQPRAVQAMMLLLERGKLAYYSKRSGWHLTDRGKLRRRAYRAAVRR